MSVTPVKGDRWVKIISTQGNIRGVAVQATDLVRSTAELHGLKGMGARGLGEAMVGGLLIASYCKMEERINLNIRGSGFYRQALVDAYPNGTVRGYLTERDAVPYDDTHYSAEKGPWGEGLLSILRTKTTETKQPYIGTVPLITGHIAKDLTFYWVQSEQIPSSVGIVVDLKGDRVASAGGFLVQVLPGASPAEVNSIEQRIQEFETLAQDIGENGDPLLLLSRIFQSSAFIVVEERALEFKCNCSWERVERALTLVGVKELKAMLKEDNRAEVKCDFCTKAYEVDASALERLIATAEGGEN